MYFVLFCPTPQVTQREFRKELRLPQHCDVERVDHSLTPEGKLYVDLTLKNGKPYKCEVTTEELPVNAEDGLELDEL